VHDPRLGLLHLKTKLGKEDLQRLNGGVGLLPRRAHHHKIIGVATEHAAPARLPRPVKPGEIDVCE
jgi:hypothetical protein